MTVLDPSNPTRIARRLRDRFRSVGAREANEPLAFGRAVELSRLFSEVRVLAELVDAERLLSVTDAAIAVISDLPYPDAPTKEVEGALDRALLDVGAAVGAVAEETDLEIYDARLTDAIAALQTAHGLQALSDVDVFVGNAIRELEITRRALDRLELDPTDATAVAEAFRAIHSVRGDAGMVQAVQVEEVCHHLETVFEALRTGEAVATAGMVAACQDLVSLAISAVLGPGNPIDSNELDQLAGRLDEGRSLAKATRLGELLVDQQLSTNTISSSRSPSRVDPVGRTLVHLRAIGDDDLDQALELQKELRREGAARTRDAATYVRRISVNEATLEKLTQAVRELQTRVVDLPTIPLVQEAVRLVEELQMQTVGTLFRKLARAARALAGELDKEVWVTVSGGTLEVHRELVDALDRPLLQLVRNALDHGIERPPVRQVSGKPSRATLTLAAQLDGNQLVVEVADDGAGIATSRVLQRAIDMGLVTPSEAVAAV